MFDTVIVTVENNSCFNIKGQWQLQLSIMQLVAFPLPLALAGICLGAEYVVAFHTMSPLQNYIHKSIATIYT